MKLLLSKSAKQDYDILKADAPHTAERVKSILKDILLHPETGAGIPTKLEGAYSGLWRRLYAPAHIILYSFDTRAVTVISIGAMESALQRVQLESYSAQEEKAVMDLMSGNRGKDGNPKVGNILV